MRQIHWYTAEKVKTNDTKVIKGQTIDNQRNGLETHAKVDATSMIRFVWNPVTSL